MGGNASGLEPPVDGDGLIYPLKFPIYQQDLDIEAISGAAESMRSMGTTVEDRMGDVDTSWSALPAHYQAPEQDLAYDVMSPAVTSAGELNEVLHSAAGYIDTYASAVDALKPRLVDHAGRAYAFRVEALEGYEVMPSENDPMLLSMEGYAQGELMAGDAAKIHISWKEHTPAVEKNEELLTEYAQIISDLTTAAANCANSINSLVNGVCMAPVSGIPPEVLLSDEVWGPPATEDRSCGESVGDGFVNFGTSIWDSATYAVGVDPETGDWSFEGLLSQGGQTLLGTGDFLLSTALMTTPAFWVAQSGDGEFSQFMRDRRDTAVSGWGSFIGYDHEAAMAGENGWHAWEEDGVAAFTESALNVGSVFLPGAGTVAVGTKVLTRGALTALRTGARADVPHTPNIPNPSRVDFDIPNLDRIVTDGRTPDIPEQHAPSDAPPHTPFSDDNGLTPSPRPDADGGTSSNPRVAPDRAPDTVNTEPVVVEGVGPRTAFGVKETLEPNTMYEVPGRGRYYTDDSGTISYVEANAKGHGSDVLNYDLQHPLPNTTYRVGDTSFFTDAAGRTERVEIDGLNFEQSGARSESVQSRIGHQGDVETVGPNGETIIEHNYDGGHLQASSGAGIPEDINVQPMLQELNRNNPDAGFNYYQLEQAWRDTLAKNPDADIDVRIESVFDESVQSAHGLDSRVPTEFRVTYSVDGGMPKTERFNNVRQ